MVESIEGAFVRDGHDELEGVGVVDDDDGNDDTSREGGFQPAVGAGQRVHVLEEHREDDWRELG